MGGGKKVNLLKICHTYPTMMKLDKLIPYLRKIQKYTNHVSHPLSSADISIFLLEISKFYYIKEYRYRLYFITLFLILSTFFESWKIFLINMVTPLMMSAKMATLGLLKKVFWNKCYDVIIYDLTQIILKMWSCDQCLVTLALLWEKLSSAQFCKDLTRKTTFVRGGLG